MAVKIGNVTLSEDDSPPKIPLGGKSTGEAVTLSDGTEFYQTTGYTPDHLQIAGTLYTTDAGGTPLQHMLQLIQMHQQDGLYDFVWTDETGRERYHRQVQIIECRGEITENSNIDYTIVLFIQQQGVLVSSGGSQAAQQDRNHRIAANGQLLTAYSSQAGPLTATAYLVYQQAVSVIPPTVLST